MRAPRFLIGAALLLWGWQSGLIWIGIGAAMAMEAPRLFQARWEFSQADLDRIWNLCVALFLGGTIYAFVSGENLTAVEELLRENSTSSRLATLNESKHSLFQLLQWLPLMFLPMALAQAYAAQDKMNLSTFSWWLRRKRGKPGDEARYLAIDLNIEYPFFGCCLFAASTGNQRGFWFFAGFAALVIWALWTNRSHSFYLAGWASSLALALALGLALQFGLVQLQKVAQRLDEALLAQWSRNRAFDSNESQTRIGAIGRLKLSGRILLRVNATKETPPTLLRQASYTLFRLPVWTSANRAFEAVTAEKNLATWILLPPSPRMQKVSIAGYLPGGKGLLAVPFGCARIDNLPALGLKTNLYGSISVDEGPGFVHYDVTYGRTRSGDSPPSSKEDFEVPPQEQTALNETLRQLKLDRPPQSEAEKEHLLLRIEQFFAQNFTYSTWQDEQHQSNSERTALTRFLLQNHSGHCEYFATATVLLLRAAGIPARYATGYSVQERKGHYYIIRERHSHAWCIAWIGGAWRDVDTTPSDWAAREARRASAWEPFQDALSRIWFEISRWRWSHAEWKRYLLWLILPLLLFAFGKLLLEKQWSRARGNRNTNSLRPAWPGSDSEFYSIERKLHHAGYTREPGETIKAWLNRLERSGSTSLDGLRPLLDLHYRLRFDPEGLASADRNGLRAKVLAWLANRRA